MSIPNRSLAPREHGAYGQIFAPVAAALIGTRFTVGGLAFAVAGVCAFYAHEPWLVLSGKRGARAERELLAPAKRRLMLLLGLCLSVGVIGLLYSRPPTRIAAISVGVLGLSAALFSRHEFRHSTLGEVWGGAVLSSLSLPIALAGGLSLKIAFAIAVAWSLAFGMGVFAVKGVLLTRKNGSPSVGWWGLCVFVSLLMLEAVWAPWPVVAVAPLALASLLLRALKPSPKALRLVGWTLVAFTIISAALMVFAARVSHLSPF